MRVNSIKNKGDGSIFSSWWTFGTLYGTCQQVTNATLLAGGLSNTVAGLYPGWSTYVSTFVYGNYGGGLVKSVYTGARARDEY